MYQVEHDELFAGIRAGKALNDGGFMAYSTLMGIMGRMATYTGKTIIVTGASSGIGRALCLALAPQRPRLVLSGRDEARLEQAAEEPGRREP